MEENYIFPFLWMRGEEEQVLRREIDRICSCGIRAVCVEARPHDDFCGPGWWHDMDIVLDEAKSRDMKVWILDDRHFPTGYANGLIEKKYPERKKQYLACSTADIFGARHTLTLDVKRMCKPAIGFWEIGNPVDYAERENNTLLALVALRFAEGGAFQEEAVDLTACCVGGRAVFTLPEGQWRVHALYRTRTDGGDETYINMLDSVSAHTQIEGVYEAHYARYAGQFGKTIAGFFSDEPQLGNLRDQAFDTRLGRPKMPLPWSGELEELLRARWGGRFGTMLPLLFAPTAERREEPQARYDYMDCVSRLYAKNFARPIGEWCRAHGVEYIGHVVEDNSVHSRLGLGAAHWFRAMEGQDMAGIDVIGGQYCFGAPVQERKGMVTADGAFFHYALGKLGASAGHLDPRKQGRTMCELFGAYGWGFGVRNMQYLLDHLLSKGVNRLVPHAFSMAEYPDPDCPPHFYARGHNPQFPFFAALMRYANRLCGMFSGGTHVSSVAVLYDAELDWAGERMPMQDLCRALTEAQIEFDIVSLDMLRDLASYHGRVSGGALELNGVRFGALLVPRADFVPQDLLRFAESHAGFPVFFVGGRPLGVLRDAGGAAPDPVGPEALPVLPLETLAEALQERGMAPLRAEPPFPGLNLYHYKKDGNRYFLMNDSAGAAYSGTLYLPAERPLAFYDGHRDCWEDAEAAPEGGIAAVRVELEPGESCVLAERGGAAALPPHRSAAQRRAQCSRCLDLSAGWLVTCEKATGEAVLRTEVPGPLSPVSDTLPNFSGLIRYTRELTLDTVPELALLCAEQVYEVMRVSVNGETAGLRLTPPYQLPVTGLLRPGKNTLCIEVAATPARDQLNYPSPPFDFSYEALEPTGMFGRVELRCSP